MSPSETCSGGTICAGLAAARARVQILEAAIADVLTRDLPNTSRSRLGYALTGRCPLTDPAGAFDQWWAEFSKVQAISTATTDIARSAWQAAENKIGSDIAREGKFALGIMTGGNYTLTATSGAQALKSKPTT